VVALAQAGSAFFVDARLAQTLGKGKPSGRGMFPGFEGDLS